MIEWRNPPTLFPRDALHQAVVKKADEDAAKKSSERWCVAFSGGADSLALLLTVWAHWPEQRVRLVALHFNHRLRGADSDGDAAFCGEVCAALGIGFRKGEWREANDGASEADARAARLTFFAQEMKTLGSLVLWTGHQIEDVAETLLMRIARGSGSAGLAAPRPVQTLSDGRVFLRPLLTLTKAGIIRALNNAGAVWREDASNAQGDFFRNRVRVEVVPGWRAAAENDALSGAALTRELLDDDDTALSAWLKELMPSVDYDGAVLDVRALAGKPRALFRRALRQWHPLTSLSRAGFEEALAVCEKGSGRVSAGEGIVEIQSGILRYLAVDSWSGDAVWSEASLREGAVLFLPDGSTLGMQAVAFDAELRAQIQAGKVDSAHEVFLSGAQTAFRVRPWQAGDRYCPLGSPGSAKLQDLFVNRKIPAARRRRLPVVIGESGTILWVPGFPPAEESKMTDDSVTGVHLTYETGTYTVHA